ncbi:hypothetical protein TeGR_g14633, partial [Tetraparma gracilis]
MPPPSPPPTPGGDPTPAQPTPASAHISALISSLALGARAASSLHTADSFAFHASFPAFSRLSQAAQGQAERLLEELSSAASFASSCEPASARAAALERSAAADPERWDQCADVIEALLDAACEQLSPATGARGPARAAAALLAQGAAASSGMPKPQKAYTFAAVDNSRRAPFVPRVPAGKPHAAEPLELKPAPGHGLAGVAEDEGRVVAPAHHYGHPYLPEIRGLQFQPFQLDAPPPLPATGLGGTLHPVDALDRRTGFLSHEGAALVETEADLARLSRRLAGPGVREIAVDLEHHSHRSFAGFTCLIQLSVRPSPAPPASGDLIDAANDFVIDALSLRRSIPSLLAPAFADPSIVKVMHGADSDVLWLQRDFGIYVVNLFDTYRSSRLLGYPARSLKHLLERHAGYAADKSRQLADWRERPLPPALLSYARGDTHFLLDVYDRVRRELGERGDGSARQVLEDSRAVCLRRYEAEPFWTDGWRSLLRAGDGLSPRQEACLSALWDWRDQLARDRDESPGYVCPGQALVRVSRQLPTKLGGLLAAFNPVPPLVDEQKEVMLAAIAASAEAAAPAPAPAPPPGRPPRTPISITTSADSISQLRASASPFSFKPADGDGGDAAAEGGAPPPPKPAGGRAVMSPVLGTEQLYKQAGWLSSPSNLSAPSNLPASAESPRHSPDEEVVVAAGNRGGSTSDYPGHSIEGRGVALGGGGGGEAGRRS